MNKNISLQGGKYLIEKILGQGGFGITYLAEQTGLNRKVAIKEFFMKELCDRDATNNVICTTPGNKEIYEKCKNRFKKEAQLIASFDNPHIVRIHDVFEENATVYYVMEFITGSPLQDLIGKNGMDEATALSYIKQVGEALSYIHKKNILHLDVKPANILVNKEGKAILIDFGISKGYNKEGVQTTSFVAGISKGFAPIEQYSCNIEKFTPATDIYSLGATLMALLTGQYPPEAISILQDGFPKCPDNINESLWAVIKLAMSPKVEDRPADVDTFLLMLNHCDEVQLKSDNNDTVISKKKEKKSEKKENTKRILNKLLIKKIAAITILLMCIIVALAFGLYTYKSASSTNISSKIKSTNDDIPELIKETDIKYNYELTSGKAGKIKYVDNNEFNKNFNWYLKNASKGSTIRMKLDGEDLDVPIWDFQNVKKQGARCWILKRISQKRYIKYRLRKLYLVKGKVIIESAKKRLVYLDQNEFNKYYQEFVDQNPGAKIFMISPSGHIYFVKIEDAIYKEREGYKYN